MSRLVGLFLAGCSLLLGACGGGPEQAGQPAPAPSTDPAPAPVVTGQQGAAVPVPAVLDFTAAGIGGGEIQAARYAGRPVVLWFWSPW